MTISPQGSTNLAALTVPNLYVQLVPPNALLNGIPTNIIGVVGTASWGPLNAPTIVGPMTEQIAKFGTPQPIRYDLGTAVYFASLQGASNFRCVRVSDGTDTFSTGTLIDSLASPVIGADLTAFYTGTTGNTINATITTGSFPGSYNLSIYIQGGIPEVFQNITGTGNQFWLNLIDAVNNGQSVQRGPSRLVVASLPTGIGGFTISDIGSYSVVPTVTVSDGFGATFSVTMKAASSSLFDSGSGYEVGDTITLSGGTLTSPVIVTVETVDVTGGILTYSITSDGVYTDLPTNPVSQDITSGVGVGAQFDILWGINAISVVNSGSDYLTTSVVSISDAGGASATVVLGSVSAPGLNTRSLSGGTNGSDVTSTDMIGNDFSVVRTGMYALRNNVAGGTFILADTSDPLKWSAQQLFALEEGTYCIATMDPGFQDDIELAIITWHASGIDNYAFSLMLGDWCQVSDPFNNLTRFISPQSFKAGVRASTLPSDSCLNKPLNGIIATQKTLENRSYSTADLSALRVARIELLTNPIPSGSFFGCRFGINSSSNSLQQTDNYTSMVNFVSQTILNGLGPFVGKAQTVTVRQQAISTLYAFFYNLFQLGMIGDVNNPGDFSKAVSIVLDASNNPPDRVALGYMQADITVVLFSIVQYFVVNLNATQGSLVSILPPQNGGI